MIKIINLLNGASLLALAKSIYYFPSLTGGLTGGLTGNKPHTRNFFYLIFCLTTFTKEERKNTLQNESGEETLNRNHRAYNVRLPQLQLMMATHAQL